MYILESRDDPKTQKLLTNMSKHVPDGQFGDGRDRPSKTCGVPMFSNFLDHFIRSRKQESQKRKEGRKKNEEKSLKEQKPLSTAIAPSNCHWANRQASNSNSEQCCEHKDGEKKAKRPNCVLSPIPWIKSCSPKRRKLSIPVFPITISERNLDVVVVPDLSEIQRQM